MVKPTQDPVAEFQLLRPKLEAYAHSLEALVGVLLRSAGLDVHVIEQRTKSVKSFGEKITRSGKTYTDPVRQITDLVGLRVVLYYPEDIEVACAAFRAEFKVNDKLSVDKRLELAPDQFGYTSVHLIAQLSRQRARLTEWKPYSELKFELQVRTVLQHAWASISHAFQYKQEEDIPANFKRRLGRLAGLLEVADEEFSGLRRQRAELGKVIAQKLQKKEEIELTHPALVEYLAQSQPANAIARIVRSTELVVEGSIGSAQLIDVAKFLRLDNIADLDAALAAIIPFSGKFFPVFAITVGHPKTTVGNLTHWVAVALWASNLQNQPEAGSSKVIDSLWSKDYKMWIEMAVAAL